MHKQKESQLELNNNITGVKLNQLKKEVSQFNKQNKSQETNNQSNNMGKSEFLKLLTIQLSKQDPLSPMKNTEFISQMAQFSALEQMTKISSSIDNMTKGMNQWQAQNLIGKNISFISSETGKNGSGTVLESWFNKNDIKLLVNDTVISYKDITKVKKGI